MGHCIQWWWYNSFTHLIRRHNMRLSNFIFLAPTVVLIVDLILLSTCVSQWSRRTRKKCWTFCRRIHEVHMDRLEDYFFATNVPCVRVLLRYMNDGISDTGYVQLPNIMPLGMLKKFHYQTLHLLPGELIFKFAGSIIADDDTSLSLGIFDEDIINIFRNRTSG